jgi:hypothetical protein
MAFKNQGTVTFDRTTLTFGEARSLMYQAILVAAAVVLPTIAHLTSAPVRILLPMHWPVILAGLIYGWRGGAMVGLLSPVTSYLISGFPLPGILPAMTAELVVYGFAAGLLRGSFRLNPFLSVALSLLAGRVVFILFVLLGTGITSGYLQYFKVALLPGLAAAAGQVIILPFIARWWVKRARNSAAR